MSRARDISDGLIKVSETSPSSPIVGQRWFRLSTSVTYQYTNDGTSSFWLDISSGGIGTSAFRGVDYVGDADPFPNHNGGSATLSVGQVYYNREKNRHFVCTTATTDANVWSGRFAGIGGIQTAHTVGSNHYKIHTFLSSGIFYMDSTTTCDYLVIAGGGGGGTGPTSSASASGGGGAGGFRSSWNSETSGRGGASETALSVTAGEYAITVGIGGNPVTNGANSVFSTITSIGGGKGNSFAGGAGAAGTGGGAGGGGGGADSGTTAGGGGTTAQGYDGGAGYATAAQPSGGGGGGAGAVGANSANYNGGNGGAGLASTISGASVTYAGGGGGGGWTAPGTNGTGGSSIGGNASFNIGGVGLQNTGSGGGSGNSTLGGGAGGSGIVIIRYLIA